MMEFIGDTREGGAKIVSRPDLKVAATGLERDRPETWIGQITDEDVAHVAAHPTRHGAPTLQPDAVNHDVLARGPIGHVELGHPFLTEARPAVLAVAHHENDGPA